MLEGRAPPLTRGPRALEGKSISVSPTRPDAVLRTIGLHLIYVDATGLTRLDSSASDPNAGDLALTGALIGVTFWLASVTRDMARATKAIATTSAEEAALNATVYARRPNRAPTGRFWSTARIGRSRILLRSRDRSSRPC